jgi:hypothetical protein
MTSSVMFGAVCIVTSSVAHCYVCHEIGSCLLSRYSSIAEIVFSVKEAKYESF